MDRPEPRTEPELRRVPFDDAAVAPLLSGLGEEYRVRYGEIDELEHARAAEFEPPHGAFYVITEDGVTVAGGGFRRLD
ncbi:MAG: GNAT family N-acetyltransferase, partial [Acidimicrobiales bacterium]